MAEILATHRPSKSPKNRAYDAMRDDPVVAPPLWGARKIAATSAPKPPEEGAPRGWFSELNYTPSHRAAAGLGAEAVRRNQEVLMAEAWSQLAELREINRRLNQTRLAAETGKRLKATKIDALPVAEASVLASPFKTRLGEPFQKMIRTLDFEAAPEGLTSAALNRIARRKGPLGRKTALRAPLPSASLTWFSAQRAEAQSFAEFSVPAGLSDTNFIAQLGPIGLTDEEEAVVEFELGRDVTMRPVPLNGAVLGAARKALPKMRKVKSRRNAPQVAQVTQVQKQQSLRANRATIAPVFNPAPMLQARLKATLDLPEAAYQDQTVPPQQLVEPIFDLSGYTMLRDISPDAVMPGVSAVPMNSVGLCEVNAGFVESWLVGANAEMAREFLWREYPGRLDGTYFRRFWDTPEGEADIAPISTWKRALGKHQIGPGKDGLLVLLLKAEVLARFPELRIYASSAQWTKRGRREEARHKGRPSKTLSPRFGGWLDKRTAFFAFELKVEEARGEMKPMGPNPGWFFVFEQPREGVLFGMDVPRAEDAAAPEVWADLSWSHALDALDGLGMETHASITRGVGAQSLRFDAGLFHETWGRSASAQARITLQRPARVLMHASAMLS
ncbi:hypothetical protein [uncultured Celeribacter sp.]|uniref:hypothetical protein n=1 Tax=uncultured Celeribacter sp. TaxID=1303376 RepID=UPI002AA8D50B|nr:hypothetical protein [uncultured Celeribacter sp.]